MCCARGTGVQLLEVSSPSERKLPCSGGSDIVVSFCGGSNDTVCAGAAGCCARAVGIIHDSCCACKH
jgi:hypothetical protein